MMVVFVALLAAAFVCATLKAGVQNEPATTSRAGFDKLCAMTSTAPQKPRGQVPRLALPAMVFQSPIDRLPTVCGPCRTCRARFRVSTFG